MCGVGVGVGEWMWSHFHVLCDTASAKGTKTFKEGARCSSVVRAFAHGAMGCRIDPSTH